MLPQQKPQVQVELKAICNAFWGQTAACAYTIPLKHLRQQFWGLSIHAVLIPGLYSQLAWVTLTATPHGKHREHSALTAPTKVSHTHHLAEPPCQALLPGGSSTCQHVPHQSAQDAPHHSHSQAEITFLYRMGSARRRALHTHHLCATHLYWKAQRGAHELTSEVLTYGEKLLNNMNSLLVGTKQKTLSCLLPWHSWASPLP